MIDKSGPAYIKWPGNSNIGTVDNCGISGDDPKPGKTRRCEKCRRTINGFRPLTANGRQKKGKEWERSISELCWQCANYEIRLNLATLDLQDIANHVVYVEDGNREFNEKLLKALIYGEMDNGWA